MVGKSWPVVLAWSSFLVLVILPLPISAMVLLITGGAQGGFGQWISTLGFLPWNAWRIMLSFPLSLAGLGALVLLAVILQYFSSGGMSSRSGPATRNGPAAAKTSEHGAARWTNAREVKRNFALWNPKKKNVSGIFIGAASGLKAWVHAQEQHLLLLGISGAGKSRRIFLQTIAIIGDVGKESMVISDPKGELYAHTSDWLQSRGYNVIRLDFRNPASGRRWNPLDKVREYLEKNDLSRAAGAARDIGHVIAYQEQREGSNENPLWPGLSESLITACILAVASGARDGSRKLTWPTPDQIHLGSVFSLLSDISSPADLDRLFAQFHPSHPAAMAYVNVKNSEAETRSSVMTVATANMRLFADPTVAWLTSERDFELDSPGKKPTAIFLVIPDEKGALYPLVTLFVKQLLESLTELATISTQRSLPVRVNFLLDEFGNLPKIPDFEKTVAVARSRNIRILLGLQNLEQLTSRYGQADAGTIKGNLGVWVVLTLSDMETATEISQRIGSYTYVEKSQSGGSGRDRSTSMSRAGRELMKPEEVLRWPKGMALVLKQGEFPSKFKLHDLSYYDKVWPHIQTQAPEPEQVEVGAVDLWFPFSSLPGAGAVAPAVPERPAPKAMPAPMRRREEIPAALAGTMRPDEIEDEDEDLDSLAAAVAEFLAEGPSGLDEPETDEDVENFINGDYSFLDAEAG